MDQDLPDARDPGHQRRVLGRAIRLLDSAADFDQTLQQTLAACLPSLGDFGFFDVVLGPADEDVRRTSAAHEAPEIEAVLAPTRWQRRVHATLNLCALTSGEPALHPDIGEDWWRQVAGEAKRPLALEAFGLRSMISVPVRHRDELVGALTLFMAGSGRRHEQAHLELASELGLLAAPLVVHARMLEQQRRTEAALRESSERLRMAVEAGQVGIWDWHIPSNEVTWTDRVYQVYGLAPGAKTGGFAGFLDRLHPEDRDRVHNALKATLAGGAPYATEFRSRRPGGRYGWISARSRLIRDAAGEPVRLLGTCIDITERVELLSAERRARIEAEQARARFERLAAAGARLASSLDPEDTLLAVAQCLVPAIADWCRIDLLDEQGVPQRRLAYHPDPERSRIALEMARGLRASSETVGSMGWCISRSQSHYGDFDAPPASEDPVLRGYAQALGMRAYFTVPLVARGRTIGAMRVAQAESGRDIAEADRILVQELAHRAALAIDNARAYAEAEAARKQAESASRAKDEFLAMLGHELRNPLAPIATALELMGRRDAAAHVQERKIIGRQVAHLSRLIDDLLDVSRITQGKIELKRVPLDVRSIAAHALEQTQPLFERRAHPVQVHLPELPVTVEGDATRLTQVVCNLLVNAAKFTPADGRVKLAVAPRDGSVEVRVEDTGCGITADLLPQVFDLFVQGRQSLARQAGGLGLGLGIVRMLVQLHGGSVEAHSDGPGRGSCFVVRLPALAQQEQAADAAPEAVVQPANGCGRILIVDDNKDAADTLAELLRLDGYEVRCAGEADAAMAVLEAYRPQLALLDIGLPGQDGYALARRLRGDPRAAQAKLVALTGYGRDNDRARALEMDFDEHLVKPVAADRLLALVQQMIR